MAVVGDGAWSVALSFDNGPHPEATPFVLDVLGRRRIGASFFMVGDKLARHLTLAERAHAEGHWIGNHTFTHAVPLGLLDNRDEVEREIASTQSLIGALSHQRKLFRPFGGGGFLDHRLLGEHAARYLMAERYSCILWNCVPRDWEDPDRWDATALSLCSRQRSSLVVLHDLPTGAMTRLEAFIDAVLERGGTFRQDYPEDCVAIDAGVPRHALALYGASAADREGRAA